MEQNIINLQLPFDSIPWLHGMLRCYYASDHGLEDKDMARMANIVFAASNKAVACYMDQQGDRVHPKSTKQTAVDDDADTIAVSFNCMSQIINALSSHQNSAKWADLLDTLNRLFCTCQAKNIQKMLENPVLNVVQ